MHNQDSCKRGSTAVKSNSYIELLINVAQLQTPFQPSFTAGAREHAKLKTSPEMEVISPHNLKSTPLCLSNQNATILTTLTLDLLKTYPI